jgi:3-oxoacyl-[acyl-carrier-protein] synthase I
MTTMVARDGATDAIRLMNGPALVVIDAEAITPLGDRAAAVRAALDGGLSGLDDHPFLVTAAGDPAVVGRSELCDNVVGSEARMDRLSTTSIARFASRQRSRRPCALVVALPADRPGVDQQARERLKQSIAHAVHRQVGPVVAARLIVGAQVAGVEAVCEAATLLSTTPTAAVCIVAVDSLVDREALEALDRGERVLGGGFGKSTRWGLAPSEGAAVVMVSRTDVSGTTSGWTIDAAALTQDPVGAVPGSILTGRGLTRVVRAVCPTNDSSPFQTVMSDQSAEIWRADDWGFTFLRVQDAFSDSTRLVAPADQMGELGAATALVHCALAVTPARRAGHERGPVLICASARSGARGALRLQRMAVVARSTGG